MCLNAEECADTSSKKNLWSYLFSHNSEAFELFFTMMGNSLVLVCCRSDSLLFSPFPGARVVGAAGGVLRLKLHESLGLNVVFGYNTKDPYRKTLTEIISCIGDKTECRLNKSEMLNIFVFVILRLLLSM